MPDDANKQTYLNWLGGRVREVRRLAGLSQLELAQKVSCNVSTISRIESGETATSSGLLEIIARVCRVSPTHFVRGE